MDKNGNVKNPSIIDGMKNAPGLNAIQHLINLLAVYTLLGCLVIFLVSLIMVAAGPRLGLAHAGTVGKGGMLASVGVAFLVGIAGTVINFAYNA